MKCDSCNKRMSHYGVIIHAGVDWYPRHCIFMCCDDCKPYSRYYNVETNSRIIQLMLRSNIRILNKLALLLADNYQMMDGYVIKRNFKPHNKFKKWLRGVKNES